MNITELRQQLHRPLTFERLGSLVRQLTCSRQNIQNDIPEISTPGSYARHIYTMDPLEIALLRWPPQVESAIHLHKGFWGFVFVVEGVCDNITYQEKNGKLVEHKVTRALSTGVIPEPDGTIHKICNPSDTAELLTLHFYVPPLTNLEGLTLYDPLTGNKGVLNDKAETASFAEPKAHFSSLEENAFTFETPIDSERNRSHRIFPLLPKPESQIIYDMLRRYYNEQAISYDHFDTEHKSRAAYTSCINDLIVKEIDKMDSLESYLAIACGTGRRAIEIKEKSGKSYELFGLDMSSEMVHQSRQRGIRVRVGNILHTQVVPEKFDIITFLYAFGHIATQRERERSLQKMYAMLQPGGLLFLDLFNLLDRTEWGPQAKKRFDEQELEAWGYELGDVFYRKIGGKEVGYLHYFTPAEIRSLLERSGFLVEWTKFIGYVNRPGELLEGPDQGSIFVCARKPD